MFTLLLVAVAAQAADPGLSGTWVLADAHEAVQARHAKAVEAAVDQLPWAFRPIARPILLKSVWSCGELEVGLDDASLKTRCDDKAPFTVDRSKPSTTITGDDGKTYEVTLSVQAEQAAVRFSGSQGGQENRYTYEDGVLVVTREMFSPQLPSPVTWTVRYKRKEG